MLSTARVNQIDLPFIMHAGKRNEQRKPTAKEASIREVRKQKKMINIGKAPYHENAYILAK